MSGRILVALLVVVLTGCASAVAEPATVARQPEVAALAVLHEWEQRRAAAFESADGAAVRDLYAPSSGLAALDLRVLRAYTARGLTVYGIAAQVSEVEVVTFTERRLRVEVTDRLAQAWATTGGGGAGAEIEAGIGVITGTTRVRLPRPDPRSHRLTFVKDEGVWRLLDSRAAT